MASKVTLDLFFGSGAVCFGLVLLFWDFFFFFVIVIFLFMLGVQGFKGSGVQGCILDAEPYERLQNSVYTCFKNKVSK